LIKFKPAKLPYQQLNYLSRNHEPDANINNFNIKHIHNAVHHLTGQQWLFFKLDPHDNLNQNPEQKHTPNPQRKSQEVKHVEYMY
jgi:hypothetical protein